MPIKLSLYHCLVGGGCNVQKPKCWTQLGSQAGCASLRLKVCLQRTRGTLFLAKTRATLG